MTFRSIAIAARILVIAALALGGPLVSAGRAQQPDLLVFAAASLKTALDEIAARWQQETGKRTAISYAASPALAKQIEQGAPADLFISADLDWMDYLQQRGQIVPGSRVNLLRNTLVLVAPAANPAALKIAPGFDLAAALGSNKLAMANPDAVPAGKYGKAALESLGAWGSVEKRVVRTENVRAALALVARGEASFGIVYRTDALAEKGVRIVDTFPASSHPAIVYPAARIAGRDSAAAKALLDHLGSAAARGIWEGYGFAPF